MADTASAAGTEPARKGGRWEAYAVAALLLAVAGWQFHLYHGAKAVEQGWEKVSGVVTANTVSALRGRGGIPVYAVYINYSYKVNGTPYTAGPVEVAKNAIHNSEDAAKEALAAAYPEGGPVDVYFDPQNPVESSLGEAGTGGLLMPAVFLIFALVALMYAREPA